MDKLIKGIYIHVPFCLKKCPYCDFYSEVNVKPTLDYASLVLKELSLYPELNWEKPTVYFGGGTPSLMPPQFFERILEKIGNFSEVTVEANPATFDKKYLENLKTCGVNRISLGIQTLNPKLLKMLQRPYSVNQALKAIEMACEVFENVNIDLMLAIPEQTENDLLADLNLITNFPIKHISAYLLTFYPNTPFYQKRQSGEIKELPEEKQERLYFLTRSFLQSQGFKHYEISNFAKPGFFCQHNYQYWRLDNYLGLGPAATSFYNRLCRQNWPSLKLYAQKLTASQRPLLSSETVPLEETLALKLIMGLRLREGVNLKELGLANPKKELFSPYLQELIKQGLIELNSSYLRISSKGLFIADALAMEISKDLLGKK